MFIKKDLKLLVEKVSNSAFEDESIGVTVERSIGEEKCFNDF